MTPTLTSQDLLAAYEIEALYPVRDGYLLRTDLRCEPTLIALAIDEFEILRRSRAFRSRAWVIPESTSFPVPANDSFELEVHCVPGACIWGFSFVNPPTIEETVFGPFSFQVRESCTDVPLLSEVVRTDQFLSGSSDGNVPGGGSQNFLTKLLVIPSPGLLTVEIANLGSVDATPQLVLWGGEPVCV